MFVTMRTTQPVPITRKIGAVEDMNRTTDSSHSAERYLRKAEKVLQDEQSVARRRAKRSSRLLGSVICTLATATLRGAPE